LSGAPKPGRNRTASAPQTSTPDPNLTPLAPHRSLRGLLDHGGPRHRSRGSPRPCSDVTLTSNPVTSSTGAPRACLELTQGDSLVRWLRVATQDVPSRRAPALQPGDADDGGSKADRHVQPVQCRSKRVANSCMRERFFPQSNNPNNERDRKSMRCAWASILKSTWSLKPTGVVKITSSASGSLRTTWASGKVARVVCSIARACTGVPLYRNGTRPPVPSEFTQLLGSAQARSGLPVSAAPAAWAVGGGDAHAPSRIANANAPNRVFARTICKANPQSRGPRRECASACALCWRSRQLQ